MMYLQERFFRTFLFCGPAKLVHIPDVDVEVERAMSLSTIYSLGYRHRGRRRRRLVTTDVVTTTRTCSNKMYSIHLGVVKRLVYLFWRRKKGTAKKSRRYFLGLSMC